MADYGPTSTTSTAFESFNAEIFKDQKKQDLNESKDSDEGFSSSFSPTSESSMIQEQAIATTLHLWGNNEKEEPYFMTQIASGNNNMNMNTAFQASNSRRVVQATSSVAQVRKPTPALSTYLASNKAIANSLGVNANHNGWASQSPQTQVSSWPTNQPNPIGSVNTSTTWNGPLRNSSTLPLSVQVSNASLVFQQQQQQQLQQKNMIQNRPAVLSSQTQTLYQQQQQQQQQQQIQQQQQHSALASIHVKNLKNRNFGSPLSFSSGATGNNAPPSSLSNLGSGLDTTVDDITHLTNSFGNLTTQNDQNATNHHGPAINGFFSNQVETVYLKSLSISHRKCW